MRIRPVSIVLPLLLLAACADGTTGPGDGGIDHPTDAAEPLVRIEIGGGFVPIEWNFRNLPAFALYGDGTLVTPGAQIELYPGPALPAISRRTVSEEGIQAILREAIDATEGLPADLGDMGTIGIADAATTVVTVRAGDADRRIEAYALSELPERPQGMSEDVYRARQRLAALVTKLGSLDGWVPDGSLGPEGTFEGDAARIFVTRYRAVDDLDQQATAWPLGGPLASFGAADGQPEGYRCGTVMGEEWRALYEAASAANELTPWTDGGERYALVFRPLLPDESGCSADPLAP